MSDPDRHTPPTPNRAEVRPPLTAPEHDRSTAFQVGQDVAAILRAWDDLRAVARYPSQTKEGRLIRRRAREAIPRVEAVLVENPSKYTYHIYEQLCRVAHVVSDERLRPGGGENASA